MLNQKPLIPQAASQLHDQSLRNAAQDAYAIRPLSKLELKGRILTHARNYSSITSTEAIRINKDKQAELIFELNKLKIRYMNEKMDHRIIAILNQVTIASAAGDIPGSDAPSAVPLLDTSQDEYGCTLPQHCLLRSPPASNHAVPLSHMRKESRHLHGRSS